MVKNLIAFGLGFYLFFFTVFSASYAITPIDDQGNRLRILPKERAENAREQKQEMMQKAQERKTMFREKIASISGEIKQQRAQRISELFNQINQKTTGAMARFVEKLDTMIIRITTHADGFAQKGVDVAQSQAILDQAKLDIDEFKIVLDEQKTKDYTPTIGSEETLRSDLQNTKQLLHDDLKALRAKLVDIKQQLMEAVQFLKAADPDDITPKATTEATITNQ